MLEPGARSHLLESLRPPTGYALTHALGTTYSLDLLSLLTVPLAFSLFDWELEDGTPAKDPLAVLEALRRHAEHTLIFCQAGAICVPENAHLLLSSLEASVIEVRAPREEGVFHPKLWILRFASDPKPVLYRFVCASRNLTFDRCWDTVLILEGELEDRQKGFSANRPLSDFIQALPTFALHGVPTAKMEVIQTLLDEVRKVRFAPPEGFGEPAFRPLGIDGHRRWPFPEKILKLLVLSPFLTPSVLRRLSDSAEEATLVSRLEELQPLSRKEVKGFSRVFTLAADAEPELGLEGEGVISPFPEGSPSGLHAKLYVADLGRDSKVWTGSANATKAGFFDNVEFLVELTGKRSICGVDSLLEPVQGSMKFADLLAKYDPEKEGVRIDPVQQAIEQGIEQARRRIVAARIRAEVASHGEEDSYTVVLLVDPVPRASAPEQALTTQMSCWPITQHEDRAVVIGGLQGEVARFAGVSFPGLTSFFAFRIDVAHSGKEQSTRFVLNLPLTGVPNDRHERLLRHMLQNRGQVLRLLLLMLADVEGDEVSQGHISRWLEDTEPSAGFPFSGALLEPLLRALTHCPEKLDGVARLVIDLERTEEGQTLLPDGFHRVWDPIWSARESLRM